MTSHIGSEAQARSAIEGRLPLAPEGHGSARKVYLDTEAGVVYKVEFDRGSNNYEVENLERVSHLILPEKVKLPKWAKFVVQGRYGPVTVVAMEFIDGRHTGACCCHQDEDDPECRCEDAPRMTDELRDELYELGLFDIGLDLGNIIERNGYYYLIDLDL